jgi:hypothetical protein
MSKSVVPHGEITSDITDPSDVVANVMDNTIKNVGKINDLMRFDSEKAASAFTAISGILKGAGTNEEKRNLIAAEQGKVEDDTTLQVFANMAIGILGSSKEGVVDEKGTPGIEKLSEAFAFLGNKIDDKNDLDKDKRIENMAEAYDSLMNDEDLDDDAKKSIETAFKENPDIAKIQEALENKDQQELEEVEKTTPTEDLKNPFIYDGKNWEDFKSKAIYGAKGAIAIGLLFAPGGIFLAPLFLYATKNFGRNPNEIDREQKEAEEAALKSEEALQFLNAFKNYLPDPKEVKQKEGLESNGNDSNQPQPIQRKPVDNEITTTGNKAEEFVKKEGDSLTKTRETLKVNQESLNRVATDEATKAALARIVGGLSGTNLEENEGNKTTGHGVTTPQVGGGGVGVVKS